MLTIVGFFLGILFYHFPKKEDPTHISPTPGQAQSVYEQRAQQIHEKLARPDTDTTERKALYKELSDLYKKQANLEESKEDLEKRFQGVYKALRDLKDMLSPDRVKQIQTALRQGKVEQAEALLVEVAETLPAKALEAAAEADYQVGSLAEGRIDYLKAEKYYDKAVQLQPDNPQYLNSLGKLQLTLGHYQEAQPNLEKALDIREKTLGPDHPNTAASLNNLAELYRAQGKHSGAEPIYHRALKIMEKTLGPDNPHVAASVNNLATLYQAQGKYAEAEPLLERALKISEQALGPDPPYVASSLENYAALLRKTGREAEAAPLEARARAIREKRRKTQP